MRLLFTTFLALVSLVIFSQSPEKINYQSIVRDLAGNVIQNQPISLRMSILSDSINGTIVYQETFQPTTNNFGLVNIKIGEGTPVIATMSSVDWSNGPFFLESAVDVTGGTNYIVVSTSQFMSVPYALYAKESPLDTTQVQNIVNQQTNNFLDSSSIQNLIDSSVLNIDSTLIASWGYIDSNSIMILINNNSLDSTTIQNMIDNSIVNIDSSTVASWGYLDSSTIQILINNSTIDSSSVSNWGYLDSTTIQNIITQQTNNYLDSTSVQNMIDNSVTNIDSATISNMGFVDSMTVVNMINSGGGSAVFGEFQDITDSVLNFGNVLMNDTLRAPSDGFYVVKAQESGTGTVALKIDSLQDLSSNSINGSQVIYRSSWSQGTGVISSITCPIKKDWYWWTWIAGGNIQKIYWVPIINNSSLNSASNSTIDSTTVANWGFSTDTDTQIDSVGISNLGYVAGPHTIDTDTQIDSAGIAAMGFIDSATVQIMIDSALAANSSNNSNGLIIPTISNVTISDLTSNTVRLSGTVSNVLNHQIIERGFVLSNFQNPDVLNDVKIMVGDGIGFFAKLIGPDSSSNVDGTISRTLNSDSTYYVRAYAFTEQNLVFYGNEMSFTTLQVGQIGPSGGVVVFDKGVFSNGWRYLELNSTSLGQYQWGCQGNVFNPVPLIGTLAGLDQGLNNTQLILNNCNTNNIAAEICDNSTSLGQNDWYLPSFYEGLMIAFNSGLQINFWSSTEQDNISAYGCSSPVYWGMGNVYGNSQYNNQKSVLLDVLAVRKF